MQVHQLKKPKHLKSKRRVGRGGKRGTFSGRGVKGQKSRSGARIRPQILDYIARIPKLAGTTSKGQSKGFSVRGGGVMGKQAAPIFILNLGQLNKVVKTGDVVSPKYLVDNNLVKRYKGRFPKVKILGEGEISKKIIIDGISLSKSAYDKINAKGGTVKPIQNVKRKMQNDKEKLKTKKNKQMKKAQEKTITLKPKIRNIAVKNKSTKP